MSDPTDTGRSTIEYGRPPAYDQLLPEFRELCDVIARLRAPAGCPWDRQQTLETIKPHTLEETYELLEAIDSGDDAAIVEELGDVLLQVLLDSQIGADEQRFSLLDVLRTLTAKLIRRHPHVFGEGTAHTAAEVAAHWQAIKQQEKKRTSMFDGLPTALPALARASRLSEKAARAGFDFPHRNMLFAKLREELKELAVELFPGGHPPRMAATAEGPHTPDEVIADPARRERVQNELGDVLFVLANIARRWQISPEEALRASNAKFERRVRLMEQLAKAQGTSLDELTMTQQEELYQQAKARVSSETRDAP